MMTFSLKATYQTESVLIFSQPESLRFNRDGGYDVPGCWIAMYMYKKIYKSMYMYTMSCVHMYMYYCTIVYKHCSMCVVHSNTILLELLFWRKLA